VAEVGRGIDPTRDVAGILDGECFLCGKGRLLGLPCDAEFGPRGKLMPKLPHHATCLNERGVEEVVREYRRRLADMVSVRRFD
jgi:hypothetical protein